MLLVMCLFIFFAIIGKLLEKTWINPLSIFTIMWMIIIYLASLRLYGMREIDEKAYIIIIIGVSAFFLGYILYYVKPFKFYFGNIRTSNKTRLIFSNNVFFIVFFLTLIVWIVLGIATIVELLKGVPYVNIRDMYGGFGSSEHLFKNQYTALIVKWLFVPCVHVIVARIIYSIFDKKFKWYYYILSVVLIIFYCLTTGSRMILLYIIFQLFFMLYINKNNKPIFLIKKSLKKKIRLVILSVIIGIVVITLLRPADTSSTWNTKKTIYAYMSLSVPLLGHWVNYVDEMGIRTYGISFFRGILELLGRFKFPLPSSYYTYSELISYCSDTYVPIFGVKVFNAFVSVFFYFYLDFGYIGVIVGSVIFGVLTCAMYRNTRIEKNEFNTMVWLIYLMAVIGSFARWQFINPAFIMMFVVNRLMYKKYFNTKKNIV